VKGREDHNSEKNKKTWGETSLVFFQKKGWLWGKITSKKCIKEVDLFQIKGGGGET